MPIDRNSTWARIRSASSAAAGTSTITPGTRLRRRTASANRRASSGVAIIGAITHGAVPVRAAASAIASSWRSSSAGLPCAMRTPRTPSAGLASSAWLAKRSGLSEPASSVRITTLWPANASSTSA